MLNLENGNFEDGNFEDILMEFWHGVKVGTRLRYLGPRDPRIWDPGPTQNSKVGSETALKFKSGTSGPLSKFKSGIPGPPSKFKIGPPLTFFNEFIFFRIFHLFFTYLFFCPF